MGYRPNICSKYEVEFNDEISGFNHATDEFEALLDNLGLEYWSNEEQSSYEIEVSSLESINQDDLKDLNEDEKEAIESLIYAANTYDYCKKRQVVRVEWF